MNITIDAATASILTALIVGVITLVTTLIANNNSIKQQEMQWEKEERKAARELENAQKQREFEFRNAMLDKLQDIYGNAISSLTTLLVYDDAAKRNQKDYVVNLGELKNGFPS